MTYYKVVSIYGETLRSHQWLNNLYGIEYKLNEYVYPIIKNSKLFVFNKLVSAKEFQNKYRVHSAVYECMVKNPLQYIHSQTIPVFITNFEIFWNKGKMLDNDRAYIIPGTIFVDAVMLTKEIERKNRASF